MPRRRTKFINNGVYHIIQRGNNKAFIFENAADKLYFMKIVETVQQKHPFMLLYYVLMDNHYHMLIEMEEVSISHIMQIINHKYSVYFNRKYNRTGTIFDATFKSYEVHGERYFRKLILYIAHNPVHAKIIDDINRYKWCAHSEIIYNKSFVLSRERLFHHLQEDMKKGIQVYHELMRNKVAQNYVDLDVRHINKAISFDSNQEVLNAIIWDTFQESREKYEKLFSDLHSSERAQLRKACAIIASKEGFSISEIASYLKISKSSVRLMLTDIETV